MIEYNKLDKTQLIEKLTQLSEQLDIYNKVQSHVPSAIAMIDAESLTYRYANPYYSRLTHTDPSTMIGKQVREVIGEEKYKFAEPYLQKALKGEYAEYENKFKLTDGTRWLKVTYSPFHVKGDKVLSIVISSFDITAQKEAQVAFQESEIRYRELVNRIPEAILILSNSKVKYVSPTFSKMTGFTEAEVINQSLFDFLFLDKKSQINNKLKDSLEKNESFDSIEDIIYDRKGKPFDVEISTTSCNYLGEPSIQLMIGNISQRKKALQKDKEFYQQLKREVQKQTEDLNQQTQKLRDSQVALTFLLEDVNEARKEIMASNAELETANTDLESFAYSVSHDLRAPLRHIDGFSQILLKKIDHKSEEILQYFNKIHNASNQMHNLINDLLTFSRLGRKKLNMSTVDLNALFARLIKDASPDLTHRKIEWEIDTFPEISGDEEMLKIAFENLLSNALKFTSKEEIAKISFLANLDADNNKIISVIVEDNGVGFEMQYAHKIFGVFERLHSSDDYPGTGIGMAIVKRIIQTHKGSIEAFGKIDEGARFTVNLPVH